MRTRFTSSRVLTILALSLTAVFLMSANGEAGPPGLNSDAAQELRDAGVDQYLGTSVSVESDWGAWTQHTFVDENGQPNGPVCISGTPYSVFTKAGDPKKVLIFLQGGGACWQGFYNCQPVATDWPSPEFTVIDGQAPPEAPPFPGVFDSSSPDNVFADYSVVYLSLIHI